MFRAVLFLIVCSSSYGAVPKARSSLQNSRIVGGQTVDIKDYPYQVAVFKDDSQFCGGSIISDLWVLSAGHCGLSNPAPPQNYSMRVGSSFKDHGGTVYGVAEIITHPKFVLNDKIIDYDIGFFKASSPIIFGDNVKPIKLADKTPPVGTTLTITGWGDLTMRDGPEQLLMVQIPVIDHKVCEDEYTSILKVSANMLCGEAPGSANGFCHGDSGGPVTAGGVQVGIVSWRWYDCTLVGKANVFSDVAVLRQWIKDISGV